MRKIVFIASLLISAFSFSQSYKTAIGLKGGYPGYGSLNIKHYLNGSSAIEASIGGYTFQNLPINICLDTGPSIQVVPQFGFAWGGGCAIRYTLK
jgi:hypothetical protein